MRPLVIIPARGGSKGIPHKNIKELEGKPLICYTIDAARKFTTDDNICVSTDDDAIIKVVEAYGLRIPFKRPGYLATDNAGTNGVLLHALDFYERKGNQYDMVVLLQVTSPFRRAEDVIEAVKHYDDSIDMVTSVMPAKCNPYYDGFEDDADGLLVISKGDGSIERRQDAPRVWQQNGAVYVINPLQLKAKGLAGMTKIRKYVMDELHSVDIDNMLDWKIAEIMLKDKLVEI
ncbi:acylneuraminate cytidylyltransferase family protein [Butyricimonas virosa]|uniref:acylneuraminate cytidylyltransferase family protein n=1 Tax=Butyricimonas virosa TaxID=544645 RepID=UPI00242BA84F|nr:acylneuraminate cytidylyltransferase family protein [Butyricimonas virosa]MCI7163640.1 acylneuraminate cytidylyltransferase family protein [Butyricimonas virosa]